MRDYDQDPIVVYTPYTFEQLKRFQQIHCRKHKRVAIISMLFGVLFLWLITSNPSVFTPNVMLNSIIILLIVYEGYRALAFNCQFYTLKTYNLYKNTHRGGALYQFMNNHYVSTGEDGDFKRVIDSPYDNVLRIVEAHDMLCLYTVPTQAQLVSKDGIQNDSSTPEELSAFLREKFAGVKYERIG